MNTSLLILAGEMIIPFIIAIIISIKLQSMKFYGVECILLTLPLMACVGLMIIGVCDWVWYNIQVIDYKQPGIEVLQSEREPKGFTGNFTGNLTEYQTIKGSNEKDYKVRFIEDNNEPELQEGFYKSIKVRSPCSISSPLGKLLAGYKPLQKEIEERNVYIHRVNTQTITQPETVTQQ